MIRFHNSRLRIIVWHSGNVLCCSSMVQCAACMLSMLSSG